MITISWITYCKGRLPDLKLWLSYVEQSAPPDDQLIVVDYDDGPDTASFLRLFPSDRLTVVRVNDAKWFHADHARNVALRAAATNVVAFCDADFLITANVTEEAHTILANEYLAMPDKLHSLGFIIAWRNDMIEIQGWEEAICGYGWDDISLKRKLLTLARKRRDLRNLLVPIERKSQVRVFQSPSLNRNASVNARILRALESLHPYKNNVNRNWGWGGIIVRRPTCTPEPSKCAPQATSSTDSLNSLTPCPPVAAS